MKAYHQTGMGYFFLFLEEMRYSNKRRTYKAKKFKRHNMYVFLGVFYV